MALGSDTLSAPFDLSTIGNNQVVAAVPGARIQVIGYVIANSVATAQAFRWRGGAANNFTGQIALQSAIGGYISVTAPQGAVLWTGNVNEVLNLSLTASTAVAGHIFYRLHFA